MPNEDYVKKLRKDYEEITDKVERGMLPLVARIPAIEKAVSEYVLAQDAYFDNLRRKGGYIPIQLRNERILERMADLLIYEELRWSHPDKMTIIDYPIVSSSQERRFKRRHILKDELLYGDLRHLGKRKVSSSMMSDDGESDELLVPVSTSIRILEHQENEYDALFTRIDLKDVIKKADLTSRQREAIYLTIIKDMTQEDAADVMGIGQPNVKAYTDAGVDKIRKYLTEI